MAARLLCLFLIITGVAAAPRLGAQKPAAAGNQLDTPLRQARPLTLPGGLKPGQNFTLEADRITATLGRQGSVYHATGGVQISTDSLRLSADAMTYDSATGEATASGHVAFDSVRERTHIEGTHAVYNFQSSSGEFDDFRGVSDIRLHGRQPTELGAHPLIFTGRKLERLGPEHYRLENGMVTSCTLPNPKWTLQAGQVEVELGKGARLRHAVFRLFDVPIFYAPFLTYSTSRTGRQSGLLVPVVSKSNVKGYVLGDSFYWAALPNLNVTAGGELYSARGWADHVRIEGRPTRTSEFTLQLDGMLDRGLQGAGGSRIRQGGQELRLEGSHESAGGFRTVLDADYLSSYLYRLVFNNSFAGAINSEAISTGFTERQSDGRDFLVEFHRYQNFLSTGPQTSLSLAKLPSVNWSAYAQALTRRLPLYFSWDAGASLLDRSQPGFATGAMSRLDFSPRLRMPLFTPLGSFTSDVSVSSTYYSDSQAAPPSLPEGAGPVRLDRGLWRDAVSGSLEWRPPVLEKVFSGPGGWLGDRIEHTFEPEVGYHVTSGVDQADQIIRFDAGDILANTSEVEYGFTNRLLAAGSQPGQSRELASWTLLQKYYFDPTFGGALIPGDSNVFLTTALLSPFAAQAIPLRFSPLSSLVRVSPFTRFDGEWRLDYDSHSHQVSANAFTGNFHFGKGFVSGSNYLLRPPAGLLPAAAPPVYNQMRFATGYGDALAPGLSVAGAVAYDARTGRLQYTTFQMTHNWDCCGFSVEYRRFSLASLRRENQFLISFSLANVATFGNLKHQDQLF